MKKILTVFALLPGILGTYAQTLKEGNVIVRDNKDIHLDNLIGANSTGFYCWTIRTRGKGTDYYLEKFDLNGKRIFAREKEPTRSKINDKSIFLFTSNFDEPAEKKSFYYEEVGPNGDISEKRVLAEMNCPEREKNNRGFSSIFSPDGSKMMLVAYATERSGGPENTDLILYDAAMKVIWKQKLPVTYNGHTIRTDGYRIDNEGNMLLQISFVKQEGEEKAPRGTMAVVKANTKEFIPVSFDVSVDVDSYTIKVTNDGKAILAGVFKDPQEKDRKKRKTAPPRQAGIFCVGIDMKTGATNKSTASYFSESALQKLTYKTGAGGTNPGEKYLSVSQVVEMNGSVYVVVEHAYAITVSSSNGGSHTTNYQMELIVSKLKPDGNVEWTKVLPKSTQTRNSSSDETASTKYNFVISNNKMNFIYLDHPKNAEKYTIDNYEPGELGDVKGVRGPNVICVTLDASGNAERTIIHKNEDFCVIPQVEDILLNKKELVVYMKMGSEEKFGLVSFK